MTRLVTVFGGDGFLGRYAVGALLREGVRVRIGSRNPRGDFFLRPMAGLGQLQSVRADVRDAAAVAAAVAGADAVVNLVGVMGREAGQVNGTGAGIVARAAAEAGAPALVHVSAIGADAASKAEYARSKAAGEAAVREAFAGATILRPSILFGREDEFINRFARLARMLPVLPVIRGGVRFQPAYVADVGKAVAAAALEPDKHAGKTYALGGPQALTMRELNAIAAEGAGRVSELVDVPDAVAGRMAKWFGWLPGAPMTADQWTMLQADNVVGPDEVGFEAFGIAPTPIAAVADGWLVALRRHGRFAKPRTA